MLKFLASADSERKSQSVEIGPTQVFSGGAYHLEGVRLASPQRPLLRCKRISRREGHFSFPPGSHTTGVMPGNLTEAPNSIASGDSPLTQTQYRAAGILPIIVRKEHYSLNDDSSSALTKDPVTGCLWSWDPETLFSRAQNIANLRLGHTKVGGRLIPALRIVRVRNAACVTL